MAELLFLAIVVYLAYRFVFNFLIPVVRATHHVRQQFRDMHGTGTQPGYRGSTDTGGDQRSHKPPAEDYIDFEEVK
ncbi:MAG TPA: hypothetical protein VG101_18670 [Puia sp.]|jgi:hypothetical protein|nr:hypothetical protein [Puia sp.]